MKKKERKRCREIARSLGFPAKSIEATVEVDEKRGLPRGSSLRVLLRMANRNFKEDYNG